MKALLTLLTVVFSVALATAPASAGDRAILCKSDSTGACKGRPYCCYSGDDQSAGDKFCKNLGCKRGGTGSCPTAANVKSCGTRHHPSSALTTPHETVPVTTMGAALLTKLSFGHFWTVWARTMQDEVPDHLMVAHAAKASDSDAVFRLE